MNKETRKALVESICHWVDNYLGYREPNDLSFGSNACALCRRFYFVAHCLGCPVMGATGKAGCIRTPYLSVLSARDGVLDAPTEANLEYFRKKIHAELMFLHSLLKPTKETHDVL